MTSDSTTYPLPIFYLGKSSAQEIFADWILLQDDRFDQPHYQNYPDKIIIKSELEVISGETGSLGQWQAEGWKIIQNTCVPILTSSQVTQADTELGARTRKIQNLWTFPEVDIPD